MLAMNCVALVKIEATRDARKTHLRWPEHRLNQSKKKRYAKDHNHDGDRPSIPALHRDITEASGGESCDRKIERIEKTGDLRITPRLRHQYELGHQEDENDKIDPTYDNILMPSKGVEILPKGLQESVRPQQPKYSEGP
jgi:hypothetical protein